MAVYFVIAVCVYDVYCTAKMNDSLESLEWNTVALFLCEKRTQMVHGWHPDLADESIHVPFRTYDVSRLILFKVIGLVGALLALQAVLKHGTPKQSAAIILPVFFMMAWLLAFLIW